MVRVEMLLKTNATRGQKRPPPRLSFFPSPGLFRDAANPCILARATMPAVWMIALGL